MRNVVLCVTVVSAFLIGRLSAQDVQPSCDMCPTTYVAAEEFQAYVAVARASGRVDQQVRSLDIGRTNVQIALAHRGRLDTPSSPW